MKEFISGLAILLILLIFPLQSQVDTLNAFKINNLNDIVYNAAERARFDGYFTPQNIEEIKTKTAAVFNVDPSEVQFTGTESIRYRQETYDLNRQKIEFEVTVPFGTILPSAAFLGVDTTINDQNIVKKGYVFSEVLEQ